MVERSTSDQAANPTCVSRATRPLPMKQMATSLMVTLAAGTTAAVAQPDAGGLLLPAGSQPGFEDAMRDPLARGFDDKVKVNEHMIVDLHVQDEDLSSVLQMLSLQTQRNILTSKNVSATVTANLYGVTFYEALDAILSVNGYGYIERGNFIYVYTLQELIEIEKATRQRTFKVIKLSYLNGVDAAEFAKSLLSDGGQIKTNGRPADFSIPDNAPVGGEDFALDSTLVVFDYEENVEQIEQLLAQLDTKPIQVLVEATILQTALTEANAFGIDFTILGSLDFVDFIGLGGPLESVNALIGGKGGRLEGGSTTDVAVPRAGQSAMAASSTPGNTGGPATLKLGIVDGDVAAFLRVLDEVTDTTILSRPNLLTLNRQPARVLVGRKVGYLSTTSTDTATTQTVQFLDTGTQLYFRPFVSADGMIRMELKPQVSEAVIRNATDATGAAVTIPDEITNELVANVLVRDGQTIVLGGLFRESTQSSRRQVPWLGDLPIIGYAFRGHEDTIDRNEIIFMITPTIVNDRVLVEQGAKAMQYMGHVRAGAREGLLPFSREKQSSQLLVKAQREADKGNTESALYYAQRSLALSPNQPDAIALRERMMTRGTVWPSRRMMDDIVGSAAKDAMKAWESQIATPTTPSSHDMHKSGKPQAATPTHTNDPAAGNQAEVGFAVAETEDFENAAYEPVATPSRPVARSSDHVAPHNFVASPSQKPSTAPASQQPQQSSPTTATPEPKVTATQPSTPPTSTTTATATEPPAGQAANATPTPETVPSAVTPITETQVATTTQPTQNPSSPTPSTPAQFDPQPTTHTATQTPQTPQPAQPTPTTHTATETATATPATPATGTQPVPQDPVLTPADVASMLPEPIFALVQEKPASATTATSPIVPAASTASNLATSFDDVARTSLLRFSFSSFGLRSRIGTSDDFGRNN